MAKKKRKYTKQQKTIRDPKMSRYIQIKCIGWSIEGNGSIADLEHLTNQLKGTL